MKSVPAVRLLARTRCSAAGSLLLPRAVNGAQEATRLLGVARMDAAGSGDTKRLLVFLVTWSRAVSGGTTFWRFFMSWRCMRMGEMSAA
jgi:hypothetical protein